MLESSFDPLILNTAHNSCCRRLPLEADDCPLVLDLRMAQPALDALAELGGCVGVCDGDAKDRQAGCPEGRVLHRVALPRVPPIVGPIVELDGRDRRKAGGRAEDKIHMLPIDPVPIQTAIHCPVRILEQIAQTHVGEDLPVPIDGCK